MVAISVYKNTVGANMYFGKDWLLIWQILWKSVRYVAIWKVKIASNSSSSGE